MPEISGTELRLSLKSDLPPNELKKIDSFIKASRDTLHKGGYGLTAQVDLEGGLLSLVMDAKKEAAEVRSVAKGLIDLYEAGYGFRPRMIGGVGVMSATTNNPSPKLLAGLGYETVKGRADSQYNPGTGQVKTIWRADNDAAQKSVERHYAQESERAVARQEILDAQARMKEQKILENTPNTPAFHRKAQERLDRRKANYDENLAWARENKKHPVGKAIIRAHREKSFGGRILNRAGTALRGMAISAVLSAIGAAVGAAVKFLSQLPAVASDVRKIAIKGAGFNLTEGQLKQYGAIGNVIGMGDKGEGFQNMFAAIQGRLGSIMTADPEGTIGKLAAMSSLTTGRSIQESVKYFTGISSDPEKLAKAYINDMMRASFAHKAVGKNPTDFGAAYNDNREIGEALFGSGALTDALVQYFQNNMVTAGKADGIRKEMMGNSNADFLDLFYAALNPLDQQRVSGNISNANANQVKGAADSLINDATAVKDGLLAKIVALLEPLVDMFRLLMVNILEWLNDKGPDAIRGSLTGTIDTLRTNIAERNAAKAEALEKQMILAAPVMQNLKEKYGFTSDEEVAKFIENAVSGGTRPLGMAWEDVAKIIAEGTYYGEVKKSLDIAKSPEAKAGRTIASQTTPEAIGLKAEQALNVTADAVADKVEKLLAFSDGDIDKVLKERARAEREVQKIRTEILTPEAIEWAERFGGSEYLEPMQTRLDNEQVNIATIDFFLQEISKAKDIGSYDTHKARLERFKINESVAEDIVHSPKVMEEFLRNYPKETMEYLSGNPNYKMEGMVFTDKRLINVVITDAATGKIVATASDVSSMGISENKAVHQMNLNIGMITNSHTPVRPGRTESASGRSVGGQAPE